MDFLKNKDSLRMAIITALFVLGVVLTLAGWKMTGKLLGLGIMILGIIFLLAALFVYNNANK